MNTFANFIDIFFIGILFCTLICVGGIAYWLGVLFGRKDKPKITTAETLPNKDTKKDE